MLLFSFLALIFFQTSLTQDAGSPKELLTTVEIDKVFEQMDSPDIDYCSSGSSNFLTSEKVSAITSELGKLGHTYSDINSLLTNMFATYKLNKCQKKLVEAKFIQSWFIPASCTLQVDHSAATLTTYKLVEAMAKGKERHRKYSVAASCERKRIIQEATQFQTYLNTPSFITSVEGVVSSTITVASVASDDTLTSLLEEVKVAADINEDLTAKMSNIFMAPLLTCYIKKHVAETTTIIKSIRDELATQSVTDSNDDCDCKQVDAFNLLPDNSDTDVQMCSPRGGNVEEGITREVQIVPPTPKQESPPSERVPEQDTTPKSKSGLSVWWIVFIVLCGLVLVVAICLIIFYCKFVRH